jgi:hypothetical protein
LIWIWNAPTFQQQHVPLGYFPIIKPTEESMTNFELPPSND